MNIQLLTKTIDKICPIDGLSSANEIWFKAEATQEQKALAWDIYNGWEDPQDPDVTGFIVAISQDVIINNWYESLPIIVSNQLAIYFNEKRFEEILNILNSLNLTTETKTAINNYCDNFYIPVNLE